MTEKIQTHTTIFTDEEMYNVCCCLKSMQIFINDGYTARMLDYLKEQEIYSGHKFDKNFVKSIKSVEKKYLAALKKIGSPRPKKYNKK